MIFAGYTGSKNPLRNRLKFQFAELDFSKLIFQKSSTDQQGEGLDKIKWGLKHIAARGYRVDQSQSEVSFFYYFRSLERQDDATTADF